MAQQLKNVLAFSLAAGASVVIPHQLKNAEGVPLMPDIVFLPSADLSVVTTALSITLTNESAGPIAGSALVEWWHTIERAFGDVQDTTLPGSPFVVVNGERVDAPVITVVYAPNDPLGSRGNVFVTWPEVYAALQSTADLGFRFLEFDSRSSLHVTPWGPACPIPTGTWDMLDVTWTATHFRSVADILTGCQFTNLSHIWSQTLFFVANDGAGPPPLTNPSLLLSGPVRIVNSHVGAAPFAIIDNPPPGQVVVIALEYGGPVLGQWWSQFPASVPQGPLPAPLIDLNGSLVPGILQGLGSGWIQDNAITGNGTLTWRIRDDSAMGGEDNFQNYNFPTRTGPFNIGIAHRDRHRVSAVRTTAGPHTAQYNEAVRVDTTANNVTINLLPATPALGERVVVKLVAGAVNVVDIIPPVGSTIDGLGADQIDPAVTPLGSRTYVSDGAGNWMITARS
jgi:hypothetical protein